MIRATHLPVVMADIRKDHLRPVLNVDNTTKTLQLMKWSDETGGYVGQPDTLADQDGEPVTLTGKKQLVGFAIAYGFKPACLVVNGMAPDDHYTP